jgi:hypothetical protein
MEFIFSQTNIGSLLGLILLLLLCWYDFLKNSPKSKNIIAYYFVLLIFLSINIMTYMFLLEYIANIQFFKNIFIYTGPGKESEVFRYRFISPIILAILNFGTGAAKVDFYGKEIAIYSYIQSRLSTILPPDDTVEKGIRKIIEKMGEETEKLELLIEEIKNYSKSVDWDIPENEFNLLKEQNENLKNQVYFLKRIDEITEIDINTKEKIRKINKSINEKIIEISKAINKSLKDYIASIFRNNIKDKKALSAISGIVNNIIPMPDYEPHEILKKKNPNSFYRVLGISILFALILSFIFGFGDKNYSDGNKRFIFLTFSLFIFNFIVSFLHNSKPNITGFFKSILFGSMAGFAGHFSWIIVPYIISLFCWFAWETSAMMVQNFKLARFIAFGTCNMR